MKFLKVIEQLVLLVVLPLVFHVSAFGQSMFQKLYGSTENLNLHEMVLTSDSNVVIAGTGTVGFTYSPDIFLLKLNKDGDTLWSKIFTSPGAEGVYSIIEAGNGDLVMAGLYGTNPSRLQMLLIRTDSMGNIRWSRTYGDSLLSESASVVRETNDHGFILGGRIFSGPAGESDMFLVKTDSIGNAVWEKYIGGSYEDDLFDVRVTDDGSIVIAGTISDSSAQATKYDGLLLKLDSLGNYVWAKKYGGGLKEKFQSLLVADSGYFLAGYTTSFGAGNMDAFFVRTDDSGDVIWSAACGTAENEEASAILSMNQEFWMTGIHEVYVPSGNRYLYFFKIDANGLLAQSQMYRTGNNVNAVATKNGLCKLGEDRFMLGGTTVNTVSGYSDFYLVKTDSAIGNCIQYTLNDVLTNLNLSAVPVSINFYNAGGQDTTMFLQFSGMSVTVLCFAAGVHSFNATGSELFVYPNPATNHLFVKLKGHAGTTQLELMNTEGKVLRSMIPDNAESIEMNLSQLDAGMYFLRLLTDGNSYVTRFIKQ